jgi:uncharacterized repeat protein (TIGR03803 family)
MVRKAYLQPSAPTLTIVIALFLGLTLTGVAQAQTESVLYNFGGSGDGNSPQTALISDTAGNLYGTTSAGGPVQAGTVFKLSHGTSGWTETILYSFAGGKDGAQPCGGLVADVNGNVYGATSQGGAHNIGLVYKLSATTSGPWKKSVLFNFSSSQGGTPPIAWFPMSLIMDTSGNLYGVTLYGIKHPAGGTVFKLSPTNSGPWLHSVLYEFTGGTDGQFPALRNLTFDAQGNLYGTAVNGGTYGAGVVFKLTPTQSGPWTQTILHTFTGAIDGASPNGGLVFDKAGNLYGTTLSGGSAKCYPGCGVVFKLSPNKSGPWTAHQLFVFQNGESPYGGLIFDTAGNLFGTTSLSGTGYGTVFKLSPTTSGSWSLTVLHSFAGLPNDGGWPHATLFRDGTGNLFGSTFFGGKFSGGVVFEITP